MPLAPDCLDAPTRLEAPTPVTLHVLQLWVHQVMHLILNEMSCPDQAVKRIREQDVTYKSE